MASASIGTNGVRTSPVHDARGAVARYGRVSEPDARNNPVLMIRSWRPNMEENAPLCFHGPAYASSVGRRDGSFCGARLRAIDEQ